MDEPAGSTEQSKTVEGWMRKRERVVLRPKTPGVDAAFGKVWAASRCRSPVMAIACRQNWPMEAARVVWSAVDGV